MAFDELDEVARRKQERIEGLLAQLGGVLRRASDLPVRAELSRGRPLDEVLPDAAPLAGREGVRLRVSEVAIEEGGEGGHPRGYSFTPAPAWERHAPSLDASTLVALGCSPLPAGPAVALERIAFLDTETTGLSGLTGTYAFLVGLGYFRIEWSSAQPRPARACFVCEQFFMEDYPSEPALLEALAERLRSFDLLVTFNGARYDVPLLEARATLNRMRLPLGRPHLDLLWPARRIWRRRLSSCALSSLERHVLGVRRSHDIPGADIPAIYFDYLRGLGRERLAPVFDHNVQDIVSLGALLLLLRELTADPGHERIAHGEDAFGLGCLHAGAGAEQQAIAYFARAAELGLEAHSAPQLVRHVLRVCRRTGACQQGAVFLEAQLRRAGGRAPELYVELAKWYERYVRDPQRALEVIEDAERQARFARDLGLLDAHRALAWDRALRDLAERKVRLLRKLA
jgi:uncharacterized protein YprB with RNaseH-like and TPR domain